MVRVIFQYSNIFAEGHSFALFYSTFVQIYSNTEEVQQSYSMVAPQLPFLFPGKSFLPHTQDLVPNDISIQNSIMPICVCPLVLIMWPVHSCMGG